MSKAERLLSYSLLSLITTKPIATLPNAGVTIREEDSHSMFDLEDLRDDDEIKPSKKANGYVNEQGAWCWREGCEGMFLSKAASSQITYPCRLPEAHESAAENK
jgi:sorting nexin-9/18/33